MCVPDGRHCLKGAYCDGEICACPNGSVGDGVMTCMPPDHKACVIASDPHLQTFVGARADVSLPCRFRMTRFVTDMNTSEPTPHNYCFVEVFVTNILHRGNYFVHSTSVTLGLNDIGRQVHHNFELQKYGISDERVYQYIVNKTKAKFLWAHSTDGTGTDVHIDPIFDNDDNFAELSAPMCDVSIKFRAYDRTHYDHLPPFMPGVVVTAPPHSQFIPGYSNYPHSVCGVFSDTTSVFKERAQHLGVDSGRLALIYDILQGRPSQGGHPMREECEAAMDAFAASSNKADGINSCGPILTVKANRVCVAKSTTDPIIVFTACLRYLQNANTADCNILLAAKQGCLDDEWSAQDVTSC